MNKIEVIEQLKEGSEYLLYELPLTPKEKSRSQECTYYRCFKLVWDKMGISSDEVKQNCLKALFGVTTSKFWGITYENAIISRTSSLDIEQAKLLIDSLIWFGKQLKIENMVTSREMIHLFNTN